jgi:hypothetical protein
MTSVLVVSWLAFPLVALIGISLFKPILSPCYMVMCVPAAVLLAGWALVAIEDSLPWGI